MEHNRHIQEQIKLHKKLASVYVNKRYSPSFSKIYQAHWNRRMCQIADLESGAKVLDLGCGTGILFQSLVDRGLFVFGLDVSQEMLAARQHCSERIHLICANGGYIPVADNTFDAVFCRGSIHHMPNLVACFHEIARVLKKGGKLIFSEPSNDSILNRWMRTLMYSKSNEFHQDDHGFQRSKILPLLKSTGYTISYSHGFGLFGYIFAAFPDKFGILNRVPFSDFLTKIFIAIDNILEKIPYLHIFLLHWQVKAEKAQAR